MVGKLIPGARQDICTASRKDCNFQTPLPMALLLALQGVTEFQSLHKCVWCYCIFISSFVIFLFTLPVSPCLAFLLESRTFSWEKRIRSHPFWVEWNIHYGTEPLMRRIDFEVFQRDKTFLFSSTYFSPNQFPVKEHVFVVWMEAMCFKDRNSSENEKKQSLKSSFWMEVAQLFLQRKEKRWLRRNMKNA